MCRKRVLNYIQILLVEATNKNLFSDDSKADRICDNRCDDNENCNEVFLCLKELQ
jgi:hypothetical protein